MAAKRNPTNSDIYAKLEKMDSRIGALESWRIAEDAAKAAIQQYRRDELSTTKDRRWGQLVKDLLPLIVAVTVLAYAVANKIGGVR